MINNYDFVKKNDKEIFRHQCCEANQMVDKILEKLCTIRKIIYSCDDAQEKPLLDSQYDSDIQFIQVLIKKSYNVEQKKIFKQTLITMNIYKSEFHQLNTLINSKIKQQTHQLMRNFSTNVKIFENLKQKQAILNNYFHSLEDCDSPCKIRSDVFLF